MTMATLTRLGRPVPRTRFRGDTSMAPYAARQAAWHGRVLARLAALGDPSAQDAAGAYHLEQLGRLLREERSWQAPEDAHYDAR